MPKQYLPEFRQQIVLSIQNGQAIAKVSQRYQVPQSTLYRCIKNAVPTADPLITDHFLFFIPRVNNNFQSYFKGP